ncbi:pilus assembly protein [Herbaspirillum sp. meg3]|uniref:fimbrial biogenesis chaperone n=1 Tax=Herbaspirillum sp. meg3 TaxID=2025949 RepID=UPI000B994409|nr:fimbria/pilus periplasmic chaperone [Herbaspirillum sp. meg3]ASU37300.1 pilus assembly protein [Herbaspirillum sp. meg3]
MHLHFNISGSVCALLASFCVFLHAIPASASVVINGTRVIFPSNEREVSVRLTNEGASPGLVQMWIDKGDPKSTPNATEVPFLLTPPLFRVDPAKGQTVRMIYSQEPLPQDHESIFWLNLLEVPPRPQNVDPDDSNYVQMAFRTRIKVFFRPQALNTQEQVGTAPTKVTWKIVRDGDTYFLEAQNPTPYYINVVKTGLVNANDEKEVVPKFLNDEGGMLAPGKQERYALKNLKQTPPAALKVRFSYLNDYGGAVDVDSALTQ